MAEDLQTLSLSRTSSKSNNQPKFLDNRAAKVAECYWANKKRNNRPMGLPAWFAPDVP